MLPDEFATEFAKTAQYGIGVLMLLILLSALQSDTAR